MFRVLFTATLGLLVLAAACNESEVSETITSEAPPATDSNWKSYGEGVTLSPIPLDTVLASPGEFLGKTVAVSGRVVGVCAMMGCWVELESADRRRLKVKVDDGVIVFPQDAQGAEAIAQGTLEELEYTREGYEAKLKHEAEEMGEEYDSNRLGAPPYREIRLKGSGALIAQYSSGE